MTSSKSGGGSSIEATETLCQTLSQAILEACGDKERQLRTNKSYVVSFLDAPSGDFFWMPHCLRSIESYLPARASLRYQGVDVSSIAIKEAESRRALAQSALKKVSIEAFKQADLAKPGVLSKLFPEMRFDIIMSHDALQHNPTANVHQILRNFNSSANRLVIDVDQAGMNSRDIKLGDCRPVDITASPFHNKPTCLIAGSKSKDAENEHFAIFQLPLSSI